MGTTQQVILITTVTAGAALAQQRFVGADNTPCKAGAAALGVAEVDAVTGDSTPVSVLGIIAVEAGAAVSRGVAVQSDAQARAVPQSGDGKSCGIALDEAGGEGDVIRILRGCDMYCTEDLLAQVPERTLIELTSEEMDFDSPATVNTRVVDSCIRYADELIDAHLRGRYILPLAEIPTVLRDIAITLVRYRLYARRPEGDLPDTVKDDHKEALRQLRELRDNRLTLGLPSTQKDVPEPGEFRVRSRPATFGGRDGLLEKY